jgi:hypothetical protein
MSARQIPRYLRPTRPLTLAIGTTIKPIGLSKIGGFETHLLPGCHPISRNTASARIQLSVSAPKPLVAAQGSSIHAAGGSGAAPPSLTLHHRLILLFQCDLNHGHGSEASTEFPTIFSIDSHHCAAAVRSTARVRTARAKVRFASGSNSQ